MKVKVTNIDNKLTGNYEVEFDEKETCVVKTSKWFIILTFVLCIVVLAVILSLLSCFCKSNLLTWASCIVFSAGIVCITLFFIIICFFYQKFLIQKDKIILLENLENELLKENFNLDCKYELSKRITSVITEI